MLKMGRFLLMVMALAHTAPLPAHAESAQLLLAEYSPLASSFPGEAESCGIEYRTAIQPLKGAQFFIIGSVNAPYARDKVPGVLIEVKASQFINGKIKPIKLKHAELRFGSDNTSKFKQIPGEDPDSRLLMQVDPDLAFDWMQIADRINEGFWISASGTGLNATFKTPAFNQKDLGTYRDYAECQSSALNKYQEWISKSMKAQ